MTQPPTAEFLALQGAVAGRFSLERELGRGGMGVVFLARDVALDRPVAIKVLPLAFATQPDLRERFLREARTAAKLSHPNVVPIHLVDSQGDLVYFVMTFVDGETLGQRVRRAGPLPPSQVTRVVQEVAWALAYAHSRGVVHRDVKPDNILLDKESGRAMVTDFGIARVAGVGTMSGAGELVGTANYMSPEQASGEDIDGRSDLFSLGVTAYYALTGTLPFDGPHLPAIVTKIVSAAVPPVASLRPGLPSALAAAVDRCLAKSPAERFATGEELADAVGAAGVVRELAPQVRHLLKAAQEFDAAVGLLATIALLTFFLWSSISMVDITVSVMIGLLVFVPLFTTSVQLGRAARQMVKAGYGAGDMKRAIVRLTEQRREELTSVGMDTRGYDRVELVKRSAWWRRIGHLGATTMFLTAAVGAVTGTLQPPSAVLGVTLLSGTVALLGYLGAGALHAVLVWSKDIVPGGVLGVTERMLGTRVGDRFFQIAGIGLHGKVPISRGHGEPTEVRLAGAAGDLFARLPAALRSQFAEVPQIVERLEADAAALRQREIELGRSGAGDAESRRAAVRERLATAVAALENIRLDLMRLDVGIGSADQLTADLERAREVGAAIDAQVYAIAEVEKLVAQRRAL